MCRYIATGYDDEEEDNTREQGVISKLASSSNTKYYRRSSMICSNQKNILRLYHVFVERSKTALGHPILPVITRNSVPERLSCRL